MTDAPQDPAGGPGSSDSALTQAAGGLGEKLDRLLLLFVPLPWQAWAALGALVAISTFPRHPTSRTVVGLALDDRLSIWVSRLAILAVLAVVIAICFFAMRTILRYMEQDRWPRRAGGLEMEELVRAQSQMGRNANDLSTAADATRSLTKMLEQARLTHGAPPSGPSG